MEDHSQLRVREEAGKATPVQRRLEIKGEEGAVNI